MKNKYYTEKINVDGETFQAVWERQQGRGKRALCCGTWDDTKSGRKAAQDFCNDMNK